MLAYYILDCDHYRCFNHRGQEGCLPKTNEQEAIEWVEKWNSNCLPTPHSDEYIREKAMIPIATISPTTQTLSPWAVNTFEFAPLQPKQCTSDQVPCQKGNNPMRSTITPTCSTEINVSVPSEESKQREYLLQRLRDLTYYSWQDPMYQKIKKIFNYGAPDVPENPVDLLEAFKNGDFTVDQKKIDKVKAAIAAREDKDSDADDDFYFDRFYGITFTKLPIFDEKGYQAAVEAYEKAKQDVKDTIMISPPADGLAALKALEDWTPPTTAN